MDRRGFNRLLCGAGAGLLPSPLLANYGAERDRPLLMESRIALRLAMGQILVSWLLIASAGRMFGLNLRQEMPQYKEKRADAGDLPVLGTLFRPSLGRHFQAATLYSQVYLLGRMLVLVPQGADGATPARIIVAHRDASWEPPGRPAGVRMKGIPAVPDLLGLPVIGRAFLKPGTRRELLVIVKPSVVAEPEG